MPKSAFKPKAKVCLLSISLANGGAERSTALLSKMLEKEGFEVHIAILTDAVSYDYGGKLFNLGKYKTENDSLWKRLKRFRKLKRFFVESDFDFIIDNRVRNNSLREFYYLKYLYAQQNIIYVVRSFKLDNYFPESFVLKKGFSNLMIKKAVKIVGVAKAISAEVNRKFQTEKAVTIYDVLEDLEQDDKTFPEKYILFLGRIDEKPKNFPLLLKAYKKSGLSEENIKLKILGSGPDEAFLNEKIDELNLKNDVQRIPFTKTVYPYLKKALFLVLSSRYEGLPRVVLEALGVGTPVVSVDCKSGPNELIQNRENGLLVENHNEKALAEAIKEMVKNDELRHYCQSNAKKSVAHFNFDHIAEQWKNLLNNEK